MNRTILTVIVLVTTMHHGCTFKGLYIKCIPDIKVDANRSIPLYSPSGVKYLNGDVVTIPINELKNISETSLKVRKENIRLKYGVKKKNEIINSCREQVEWANSKNAKFIEWWW